MVRLTSMSRLSIGQTSRSTAGDSGVTASAGLASPLLPGTIAGTAGWIKAEWVSTEGSKRRARYYEITKEGRKRLEAEELRWNAVTGAVSRVLLLA